MSSTLDPKRLAEQASSYICRWKASVLIAAAWIIDHLESPLVQRVNGWEGERNTESFAFSGPCYCQACADVWRTAHEAETGCYPPDHGCSQANHDAYKFVSDFILASMAYRRDLDLKLKKERIQRLQKELVSLELEVAEEVDDG